MQVIKTIENLRILIRQARREDNTVGLVPTMGALHAGHISLIEAAVKTCDFVVVSIFVNPTQFGPDEDLDKYPRDIEGDCRICEKLKVNVVFAPPVSEMYSDINLSWVTVEKLTENLCGRFRPIHFKGVTTVCTKLFNIVLPDVAFFGQKDAQQSIVIKRMVADLNMPLKIRICPTVREPDGLAVSSRNQYLTSGQRQDALLLNKALEKCQKLVSDGVRQSQNLINEMTSILNSGKSIKIQYLSIVNPETLADVDIIEDRALVAIAAMVGSTRLIDNIVIDLNTG